MSILSRFFGRKVGTPPPRHAVSGMLSLVALCAGWSELDAGEVREELDTLFPGAFVPAKEEGNFVVEGPVAGSSLLVQCSVPGHSGTYLVYFVPRAYSEFSEYLAHVEDPELRRRAETQPCWFSVDLLRSHESVEDSARFISIALAKLAPPDASLVVHPTRFLVTPLSAEVRQLMAAGGSPFGDSGARHDF